MFGNQLAIPFFFLIIRQEVLIHQQLLIEQKKVKTNELHLCSPKYSVAYNKGLRMGWGGVQLWEIEGEKLKPNENRETQQLSCRYMSVWQTEIRVQAAFYKIISQLFF